MFTRIDRAVVAANRALLMAALAAMSAIVFVNVALRYLTSDSLVWAEEVARYLMIWLTFLGVGPVARIGGHIAIDNLQDGLPAPGARALRVLVLALVVAFCGFLAWIGIDFAARTWIQTTPVTEIPFGLIALAMPAGFALALWHLLAVAHGYVRERRFETEEALDPNAAGSL
ncbi:MAG: TRAP transporter small permease [Alphaproteobacteria bacterium]|nr:TRAP transporter small permease [Alphaproteobacteria bacterium]